MGTTLRPTLTRAEGCHVWDAGDRRYLDATSGAFCMQLGYTRPDLVASMAEAAARLPHARPSIFDSTDAASYREALLEEAGAPYTRVLFASSGSEAVDLAVQAAWWYQRAVGRGDRRDVRSLSGHYHGATVAARDLTGWPERRAPYAAFFESRRFGPPAHCVRCFRGLVHPSCGLACADAALEDSETIAAFLCETVPAAGLAAAIPPSGWIERVRRRCDESGALWIADEVLTGFGRTGALFAYERLEARDGVTARPDLVVFGKGASAGFFPLAGVLVSEEVARALDSGPAPFRHAQTFSGGPIGCAVAGRALEAYRGEGIFERAGSMEGRALEAFEPLLEQESVLEVRGLGLLWGIELAEPGGSRRPYARSRRIAEAVADQCRARGVLVHAAAGFTPHGSGDDPSARSGDAILIAPPLILAPEHLDTIAGAMATSIEAVVPPSGSGRWVETWEDR